MKIDHSKLKLLARKCSSNCDFYLTDSNRSLMSSQSRFPNKHVISKVLFTHKLKVTSLAFDTFCLPNLNLIIQTFNFEKPGQKAATLKEKQLTIFGKPPFGMVKTRFNKVNKMPD